MFRNYLVTALRNIVRHKLYSFINVCGLTIGLVCAILIILFVRDNCRGTAGCLQVQTCTGFPPHSTILGGLPNILPLLHSHCFRLQRRAFLKC